MFICAIAFKNRFLQNKLPTFKNGEILPLKKNKKTPLGFCVLGKTEDWQY